MFHSFIHSFGHMVRTPNSAGRLTLSNEEEPQQHTDTDTKHKRRADDKCGGARPGHACWGGPLISRWAGTKAATAAASIRSCAEVLCPISLSLSLYGRDFSKRFETLRE
jgi:hypothetical protein